jgi:hypothetical protein
MITSLFSKLKRGVIRASKLKLGVYLVKRVNKRKEVYHLHYPNNMGELRRKLLPGDVLLVEGEFGVSDWIKVYSSHTWSHCALFVGDQSRLAALQSKEFVEGQPNLVEAIIGKGVMLSDLRKYEDCNLRICRPRNLTRIQREAVIRWALGKVGFPYDLENVLQFMSLPFDETLPPTSDIGESNDGKYTCSSLLAAAFGQVGLEILHYYDRTSSKIVPYHYSQVQPKDFDLSSNFDIIKIHPVAFQKARRPIRFWFTRKKSA